MRFDHIIDANTRFKATADHVALLIAQHEHELARLRTAEAALRRMADTEAGASDPIFEGANNLPLGMTQTVGALPINPRPSKERRNADEFEAELKRALDGEKVPA